MLTSTDMASIIIGSPLHTVVSFVDDWMAFSNSTYFDSQTAITYAYMPKSQLQTVWEQFKLAATFDSQFGRSLNCITTIAETPSFSSLSSANFAIMLVY